MTVLDKRTHTRLLANGRRNAPLRGTSRELDFLPVTKLFTPDGAGIWLLTEIDPDDFDLAFGLCDLGLGCVELGAVSLTELGQIRGKLGLPVERDRWFKADKHLSQYAAEAHARGCIVA